MLMVELSPALLGREFGYGDILVLPSITEGFDLGDVDLTSRLTDELKLNVPFLASPMDAVTEYELAKCIALEGGIGFLHINLTPVQATPAIVCELVT